MGDPAVAADYEKVAQLAKERASLQGIVDAFRQYKKLAEELEGARELLQAADDADMRELAGEEIAELEAGTAELLERLRLMLLRKTRATAKT